MVTTHLDVVDPKDDKVSLREAVKFVNDSPVLENPREIHFSLANTTITLNPDAAQGYGQLVLEKPVLINPLSYAITIQRDPATATKHRIFEVKATSDATLRSLTLENGKVDGNGGGAVVSAGNLTIQSCTFRQNKSLNGAGGAIAVSGFHKELDIIYSTFTGNEASQGGAIHIGEAVWATITDSYIVLNTAASTGGGIFVAGSNYLNDPTYLTLSGVEVNGNTAANGGGGIYVSGADRSGTELSLLNTSIHDNQVTGGSGKGGGVYFGKGTLFLGNAYTIDNTAATGNSIYRVTPGTLLIELPGTINAFTDVTGAP